MSDIKRPGLFINEHLGTTLNVFETKTLRGVRKYLDSKVAMGLLKRYEMLDGPTWPSPTIVIHGASDTIYDRVLEPEIKKIADIASMGKNSAEQRIYIQFEVHDHELVTCPTKYGYPNE